MRRSAVALSASLVALLVLALPVLADWPGDPGTYKSLSLSRTECLDEPACNSTNWWYVSAGIDFDGTAQVCVSVDLNGAFETGCTTVLASSLSLRKGYIVGAPATSVTLHDGGLDGAVTRTVTASTSATLGTIAFKDALHDSFVDENGCTGRLNDTRTALNAGGTITLDDTSMDATDGLSMITDVRVTLKCPKP
jgi:hypothetical protein